MSQAPHVRPGRALGAAARAGRRRSRTLWESLKDPQCGSPMAETAENLADKYKIPREEVDAVRAHQPAAGQGRVGRRRVHADEVIPVPIRNRKTKQNDDWAADEHMRPETTAGRPGQARRPTSRRTAWSRRATRRASATAPPPWSSPARTRCRPGAQAAGPAGVVGAGRRRAEVHGHRAGAGGAEGAGQGGHDAGPDGPGRGERGVSRPVRRGGAGARASTARAPTWTAAPSPSGTRWPRAAPGSRRTCCTRSGGGASGSAWAAPASAAARGSGHRRGVLAIGGHHARRRSRSAVLYSFASLRVIKQYERGVTFFLGRFWGTKGPGLVFVPAGFAQQQAGLAPDHGPRHPAAGRHHPRQRHAQGERGLYMKVSDPAAGRHRDRGLPLRHQPAGPDHPPLGAGRGRAGRAAGRPGEDQRHPQEDHRRAHRRLGHRGLRRRGEGRGPPGGDEAGDGPAGRGRAGAACQGDRRAGRTAGLRDAGRGGPDAGTGAERDPASVPADRHRNRGGEQLDDDLPDSRSRCSGRS